VIFFGHFVGYRDNSGNSLVVGLFNRTREYSPSVAGYHSDCDCC
jgi:hypothetical protein